MNQTNQTNQRKLGAILSYGTIIISTLIQLLYTPFLIRMLGQSEYGMYSLVASIISSLTVLDLGFGNAIIVYTAKYRARKEFDKEKRMHGMFKIIFYIIGLVITIIGSILYFKVDEIFGNTMSSVELSKAKIMMLILLFNLVVTFMFNIYSSIINAYEKFVFQRILSIINTISKPIIMIPLLFMGYKSITMCIVITSINIIVVLSNYIYCKKKIGVKVEFLGFDKVLFLEMFSYSFFIFLSVIVDKINWSVDQFILGSVSGTIAVSIYAVASQLNTVFINLSTAISGVFLPKMSKMAASNATSKDFTDEMIKVGRIQYYIIFLMASGFTLFGREFIICWAGENYVESYYVALLLIIPLCIPLIQNLGLSIMQSMNKHKFRAIVTTVMAFINVIISYFLAKQYGAVGSALGTTISLIVCNILIMNVYYDRVIKLDILRFWKEIITITITFLIPILSIIVFMKIINLTGYISVLIYGAIYTIIYLITVYKLSMNNYERNLVNKPIIKVMSKLRRILHD